MKILKNVLGPQIFIPLTAKHPNLFPQKANVQRESCMSSFSSGVERLPKDSNMLMGHKEVGRSS